MSFAHQSISSFHPRCSGVLTQSKMFQFATLKFIPGLCHWTMDRIYSTQLLTDSSTFFFQLQNSSSTYLKWKLIIYQKRLKSESTLITMVGRRYQMTFAFVFCSCRLCSLSVEMTHIYKRWRRAKRWDGEVDDLTRVELNDNIIISVSSSSSASISSTIYLVAFGCLM